MARANITATSRKGLKVKDFVGGIRTTSRKTSWNISNTSPKSIEDLPFVARDGEGRMCWWKVTPLNTNYWHAHQVLGRAYAFDLLDLMNNPDAEFPEHILAYIVSDMLQSRSNNNDGIVHGFFEVLSEYISTGTANR